MMYGVHEYGYLLNADELNRAREAFNEAGFHFSDENDVVEFLGGVWLDDFTGTIEKIFKDSDADYEYIPYEDDRIVILPIPEYPSFWNGVYWSDDDLIEDFRSAYNFPDKYRDDLPEGITPQDWLPENDADIKKNLYEITGVTN